MKKFTLLLFATVVMINAGIAQQVNPQQKAIVNNKYAQEMIQFLKMADPIHRLNLPFVFPNPKENLLKSGAAIKLDSIIISLPNPDENSWKACDKQLFFYDSENRLVKIESSTGIDGSWDSPQIAEFSYNEAGLLNKVIVWYWVDNSYQNLTYNDFIYDDSGRLYQATTYFKDFDNWTIFYRLNFTYDLFGKPVDLLMEDGWITNNLIPSYHHLTYNSDGQLIKYRATYLYDYEINYEWDEDGNLVKESFEDFGWNEKRIIYYSYDWKGNRTRVDGSDSYQSRHEIYSYLETDYSDLVDLHLNSLMSSNEPDLTGYCPKNLISSVLKNGKKYDYFYSSTIYDPKSVTEINERQDSEFAVFPNPASDKVTFTWKTAYNRLNLKVFQLTGSCVINRDISSNEIINLEKLPGGIYIFKLIDNKQTLESGKLVVQ